MMAKMASPFADDEADMGEETFDDSEKHIEELMHDNLDRYSDEEDDDEE